MVKKFIKVKDFNLFVSPVTVLQKQVKSTKNHMKLLQNYVINI